MDIEPVTITPRAVEAIKKIMAAKTVPAVYGLRIGLQAQGASCGPATYTLGFDKKKETDLVYHAGEIPVFIRKIDVVHLAGLTLDYVTEDGESGFRFDRE